MFGSVLSVECSHNFDHCEYILKSLLAAINIYLNVLVLRNSLSIYGNAGSGLVAHLTTIGNRRQYIWQSILAVTKELFP